MSPLCNRIEPKPCNHPSSYHRELRGVMRRCIVEGCGCQDYVSTAQSSNAAPSATPGMQASATGSLTVTGPPGGA